MSNEESKNDPSIILAAVFSPLMEGMGSWSPANWGRDLQDWGDRAYQGARDTLRNWDAQAIQAWRTINNFLPDPELSLGIVKNIIDRMHGYMQFNHQCIGYSCKGIGEGLKDIGFRNLGEYIETHYTDPQVYLQHPELLTKLGFQLVGRGSVGNGTNFDLSLLRPGDLIIMHGPDGNPHGHAVVYLGIDPVTHKPRFGGDCDQGDCWWPYAGKPTGEVAVFRPDRSRMAQVDAKMGEDNGHGNHKHDDDGRHPTPQPSAKVASAPPPPATKPEKQWAMHHGSTPPTPGRIA